jgi:hypothetical protein
MSKIKYTISLKKLLVKLKKGKLWTPSKTYILKNFGKFYVGYFNIFQMIDLILKIYSIK